MKTDGEHVAHERQKARNARQTRHTQLALRQRMLDLGLSTDQIAAELMRTFQLRPRTAFRLVHGWTQIQAAEAINLHAADVGLDPEGRMSVAPSRLCEIENWPQSGRKPSAKFLRLIAETYGTTAEILLDLQDREHLTEPELRLLTEPADGSPAPHVGQAVAGNTTRSDTSGLEGAGVPGRASPLASPARQQHVRGKAPQQDPRSSVPARVSVRAGASYPLTAEGTLAEVFDDWDKIMRRRDFLTASSGVSVAGFLASQLAGMPAAAGPSTGPELATLLAQLTDHYRRLDNLLGAASVSQQAQEHHRQLLAWHRTAPSAERSRTAMLVADSGALLGWLHVDLEQYAEAGACYRDAAEAAALGGDVSTYAYLLSRMSRVLSDCGLHHDAMCFADAAEGAAGERAHAAVRSWLAVTRAYVHACLDNERSCHSDLEIAADLLHKAPSEGDPPACVRFYDASHLHKWTGYALMQLGTRRPARWAAARGALDRTTAEWSGAFIRGSAEVSAACAAVRLAQGEIEEAAKWTRRAYEVIARTGSPRNLRRVREVRTQMAPYAATRAVRELDEFLLHTVR